MTRVLRMASRRTRAATPAAVYDPSLDGSLFARFAGTVVNDGAGKASQWSDLVGSRHATPPSAGTRPTITESDANFNGHTTIGGLTSGWRMTLGGVAGDWTKLHNTESWKFWMVFRPSSSATTDTEYLFNSLNDLAAAERGISILYAGAQQAVEIFMGNAGASRMVTLVGADGECPRDQTHVLVVEKSASAWSVYLDGALVMDGGYGSGGTPSASAASVMPQVGGYDAYAGSRDFSGSVADMGFTSNSGYSALQITSYLTSRYAAVTRSPTHKFVFKDSVNHVAPYPTVRSYFSQSSSTPGATQDIAQIISRTTVVQGRVRTNGEIWPINTGTTQADHAYELRCEKLTGIVGAVAGGRTRLVVLAFGESGMSGRSANSGLPVGYPPADGTLWKMDNEYQTRLMTEPCDENMTYPVDGGQDGITPVIGPAGMFGWYLQQHYGNAYEVVIVNCAVGGSTTGAWASSTNRNTHFGSAVAKVKAALAIPNTVFHGMICDIGINDAVSGSPAWATNMSAILTALRSAIPGAANVPIWYSRLFTTAPTDTSYPGWASVGSDQDGWETTVAPKRIKVTSEPTGYVEAGHVHRDTPSNIAFADAFFDAAVAHPGPTS